MNEPTAGAADVEANAPTVEPQANGAVPALEVRSVSKYFGSVNALEDISLSVYAGQVTCVLGDNGAGKSTLIKILSGVHTPDKGEVLFEGEPVSFAGPRDARARGIATVFQDLATVPLMSVWRNFFLGNEPTRGRGPTTANGHQGRPADHARRDGQDGHRRARPGPDGGNAVGRRAPGDGDRARGVLRRQGPDPRRADLGARRAAVGDRAQVHHPGPGDGTGGDLHHPQPAPRLSRRRPVRAAQAGRHARLLRQGGDLDRGADLADGRRRRARGAQPRAPARGRPVDQGGRQGAGRRGCRRRGRARWRATSSC